MIRPNSNNPAAMLKKPACACGCVAVAIVLFVSGIIYVSCSNFFANLMGEKTYEISGDNTRFDPFAKLDEVRSRVPAGSRLVSIEATFVRSDGTMDLTATYTPSPQTTYKFVHLLDKAPENAPPVGAGRGPNDKWYEEIVVTCYRPGQRRFVTRTSGGTTTKYNYTHLGLDVDIRDPQSGKPEEAMSDPKCSTQKLWELATQKGADKNAVARIEYDKDGYRFSIDRTDVRFECDADCRVKD
jgi:hypothetical protein